MSTLVEMIEALQAKWRGSMPRCIGYPNCDGDLGEEHATCCPDYEREFTRISAGDCAAELAPILAAAREQAQELAAMKEQHSADLREIAEMAIAKSEEHYPVLYDGDGRPCPLECNCGQWSIRSKGTWAAHIKSSCSADSIVREFREKKAKVGQ